MPFTFLKFTQFLKAPFPTVRTESGMVTESKNYGKYKLVKTIRKGGTKKCTLSYPAGKKYYYKIRA